MRFPFRGFIFIGFVALASSGAAEVVIVNASAFGGATAAATSYFATNLQQTSHNYNVFNPAGAWRTSLLAHALSQPAWSLGMAKSFGRGNWTLGPHSQLGFSGSVLTYAIDGAPAMAATGVSLASAGSSITFFVTELANYFHLSASGGGTDLSALRLNGSMVPPSGQLQPGLLYTLSGLIQVSTNNAGHYASSLLITDEVPGSIEAAAIPGAITHPLIGSNYLLGDPELARHFGDELAPAVIEFPNVPAGQWYQVPGAFGYDVAMRGAGLFQAIAALPTTGPVGQRYEVRAATRNLGTFNAGDRVDFVALLGAGVRSFRISALPPVPQDIMTPWRLRLSFNVTTASFLAASLELPRLVAEPPGTAPGSLVYFGTTRVGYQVQRSVDLQTWTPFGAAASGLEDLAFVRTEGTPAGFYRVQLLLD